MAAEDNQFVSMTCPNPHNACARTTGSVTGFGLGATGDTGAGGFFDVSSSLARFATDAAAFEPTDGGTDREVVEEEEVAEEEDEDDGAPRFLVAASESAGALGGTDIDEDSALVFTAEEDVSTAATMLIHADTRRSARSFTSAVALGIPFVCCKERTRIRAGL